MMFKNTRVIIRGGGDLATGVAYRLHRVGFPIIVLELPWPLVVRRRVALATAVHEGEVEIEGLVGRAVQDFTQASEMALQGIIPLLVSPRLPEQITRTGETGQGSADHSRPATILIDARMAKRNIDTHLEQADTVIALGPGFAAGIDCHAVIETKRGHQLGRVIWDGMAHPNTGTPGQIGGKGAERILRSPREGVVEWEREIGDLVRTGDTIGRIEKSTIGVPFDGVIRGLIAPGTEVPSGMKIGDIDSRGDISACFTISDKALAIGGGVLEAILTRMNTQEWMKA
jgi:xanthine dehydrogenase accessory factor